MFWDDICDELSGDTSLIFKHWNWWYTGAQRLGYYFEVEDEPHYPDPIDIKLSKPTIVDVANSLALQQHIKSYSHDEDEWLQLYSNASETLRGYGLEEEIDSDRVIRLASRNELLRNYLQKQEAAWNRVTEEVRRESISDGLFHIVALHPTEEGHLDVLLRNTGDDPAFLSKLSVLVCKDRGEVATKVEPTAEYRLGVHHLETGRRTSTSIAFSVGAHSVDRFFIELDTSRILLLRLTIHYNERFSVSKNVWLWPLEVDEVLDHYC